MEAIVQTRYGRVRGTTAANGVCAFLGLPYAAPPVAARRLRPPQPVQPWSGIRDATAIGAEPPQPRFNPDDAFGLLFDPAVVGDDCLNLNIWTPDVGAVGRYDLDRRAVMRFDATSSLVDDPYVAERAMWAGLR